LPVTHSATSATPRNYSLYIFGTFSAEVKLNLLSRLKYELFMFNSNQLQQNVQRWDQGSFHQITVQNQ
jgi:hypothetical protein